MKTNDSYTLVGNYLSSDGEPVLATQVPDPSENHIPSIITAVSWTCRWVATLAPDVEVYLKNSTSVYWEHDGQAYYATAREWIVWDGRQFKVVPERGFAVGYLPVNIDVTEDIDEAQP